MRRVRYLSTKGLNFDVHSLANWNDFCNDTVQLQKRSAKESKKHFSSNCCTDLMRIFEVLCSYFLKDTINDFGNTRPFWEK